MARTNNYRQATHVFQLSPILILVVATLLLSPMVPAQAPSESSPAQQSVTWITEPSRDNVEVEKEIDARGTSRIRNGDHLWLLVHRIEGFGNVWWPQNEVDINLQTGQWIAHIILGSDIDAGYDFDIVAITVDEKENLRLLQYRKDAILKGDWSPIKMPRTTSTPIYRKVKRARKRTDQMGVKLVSPLPDYPDNARRAGASGMVRVQVTVDDSGKVISARAISGHPLLRDAAEAAARRARFQGMRVSEQSAKTAGTISYITYDFSSYGTNSKTTEPFIEAEQLRAQGTAQSLRNAIEKYEEALMLWRVKGNYYEEKAAATLNIVGQIYRSLGEPQAALDHYDRALSIWRTLDNTPGQAATLNNVGVVYYSLGDYQKALDCYNRVLLIWRDRGNHEEEAGALNNIGLIYDSVGDYQEALGYYNQVLPIWRALGNRSGEATTLNNIGIVYVSSGERQKALDYFNQALQTKRKVGDRRSEATTLANIGAVYDSLGDYPKALDYYNKAIAVSRAAGDQANEAATLYRIANLERERGNLTEALNRIEATLTIIESQRTKIASQELRLSFSATMQGYYEFYISVLMRLHKQFPARGYEAAALETSERGRARLLLETLNEAGADIRQGVNEALLERERFLQQQLNAKAQVQMQLAGGPHNQEQANAVAKEIEALTTNYYQIEATIRQTSPRYAALTQPQALTLRELQIQVLDSDTLLLEYALGEEVSYLWAVTPSSIKSYELPKRAEIEEASRQVYALLTDNSRWARDSAILQRSLLGIEQSQPASPEAATRLSLMVLGPAAAELGTKRLLIIGDGALQFIPFGALPLPKREKLSDYQPLIAQHEVVSLPSASTLYILRREVAGRKPVARTLAVLADPVFEPDDPRVTKTTALPASSTAISADTQNKVPSEKRVVELVMEQVNAGRKLHIPRLPGTRQEAEQILALVPPQERKEALDFSASRATITDPEMSQYRYVHLATHGFLNTVHPELSGVVLSLVDERGTPQDGFLRAHEVFNLRLPAEMVVLSACQTGLGKQVKGEGLVGLTRGFMYAGAPRVVVSLWSINDAATAELMGRFYRRILQDDQRPAAALRAAQLEMLKLKRWSSPFYWAAFTLEGEWK